MQIKPKDWYNENYFYPNKRTYVDQFGVSREYPGPSLDWHGMTIVAGFIKEIFPDVKTIYDIGCSAGSFVSRSRDIGFDTTGCDISTFAIQNCLDGAKGKVRIVDITKEQPSTQLSKQHDMVIAFDLLEHIYMKDLDLALKYITESVKPGGFVFFCIATVRADNEQYVHPDEDTPVPSDKTWQLVSGHVNNQYLGWWINKIESCGIKTDYEKMMKFQLMRVNNMEMKDVESWGVRNVYVGRK